MDQTKTMIQAIEPSISGVPATKSFTSSLKRKRKGKSKRRILSVSSKAARLQPDLDIVSGFAFLSFSTIEELGCHIEDHEVNTRSLSINVERKRRKRPQKEENPQNSSAEGSHNFLSKRIKIPSQKILESYSTVDFKLNKVGRSNVSRGAKRAKIGPFPGNKTTSTNSTILDSNSSLNSTNAEYLKEKDQCFKPYQIDLPGKECISTEVSLECSERIGICLFEDEDASKPVHVTSSVSGMESVSPMAAVGTEMTGKKKKKKKRKRDRSINDQTCQTMFRIKKKKKNLGENTSSNTTPEEKQKEIPISIREEEAVKYNSIAANSLTEDTSHSNISASEIIECKNMTCSSSQVQTESTITETEANKTNREEDIFSPPLNQSQMSETKSPDSKVHRLKVSNKVEKIDYCARSGGVSLVEKHHEKQDKLKQLEEPSEYASCGQQFPLQWENESQGSSCDVSTGADHLSENSGNDSSNNSSCGDQEFLINARSRIFSGSSSVFVSSLDETNDTFEVDIEAEEAGACKPLINIVKALPKSYMFGHLSSFPDKTTKGTIDVSIQVYENDIQLYMNYAADFEGKIIKIIVPDTEDSKTVFSHSSQMSGLPKFLQPQEYVKAVRCATERNRRHTIVDLFQNLKNELFGETRDFYFSKQAILSKAIETMTQFEVEYYLLETKKNAVSFGNKELRKKLNILLFGKDLTDDKLLDLNKVTEYLKTLDIEIEIPPEGLKKDGNNSQGKAGDNLSKQDHEKSTQVSRKGRPPSESGKFLKTIKSDSQENLPNLPKPRELSKYVSAAFNSNMKHFVAIAPSDNKMVALSVDQTKPAVEMSKFNEENVPESSDAIQKEPTDESSGRKIVCNLTKYRVHQQPSAMTIVTNPEPVKGIESKNVVHIKISNDTMKEVRVSQNISALRTNRKLSVSLTKMDIDSKCTNVHEPVGIEQVASIASNIKECDGSSKPLYTISKPMNVNKSPSNVAVSTKSTSVQCKLEGNSNSSLDEKTDRGSLKESESNQSQLNIFQNICESTGSTADENSLSAKYDGSCLKKNIASEDEVESHNLEDTSVGKDVVIATVPAAVIGGLKAIIGKESATTPTYMVAKPQCTSQVGVSLTVEPQTLRRHQSIPAAHMCYTTIKPLQGKPLITLANVQQNQVVTPVTNSTSKLISIQSKPVAPVKQITQVNTAQSFTVLPVTARNTAANKVMPILNMQPLKPAKLSTQRNVTLLPMTANTTTTCGTHMVQITPSSLTQVVTPQSIAALPKTSNVTMATHSRRMIQMTPTVTKVLTPQSIAVLPMTTNVTMVTNVTPVLQIARSTATPQSISVLPIGTKCTPIQMTQVTSQHDRAIGSSSKGRPPASRFVTLARNPSPNTPHAVSQNTFYVPNAVLPGMASPFRIVFKPTGQPKVVNSPFPRMKSIIESAITLPNTKTALIQQSGIPVATSITTSTSEKLNNKVFFQDKVPVTNKPVYVQSVSNASNIPIHNRHLIMKASPLHVVSVPQPPQSNTIVRVQQAMPKPILYSSVSLTPDKLTQTPSSLTELRVHNSPEDKDIVNKPSSMLDVPLNPIANSVQQLLVAGPLNTQGRVQNPAKASNIHSNNTLIPGNNPTTVGGRPTNVQLFKTVVPLSVPVHSTGPILISPGHQDKETGSKTQLTPKTTSDSTSGGSKEAFSEMEKILAKIPSPIVTNTVTSTNASHLGASSILRSNVPLPICSQKPDYDTRAATQTMDKNTDGNSISNINGQVFKSVVKPLQIADTNISSNLQMTTSSTMSQPFSSVSNRNRMPSNQPNCSNSTTVETTKPTPVTFSNTCSSTKASPDNPKPKGDKTCSVVDSPQVISHMVSADTLSVCNIDSSIPDITSELTSRINPLSIGYSSSTRTSTEWSGGKDTLPSTNETSPLIKSGNYFELQDESTAEDFDLLSTFEWNNDVSNDNNACSPAGHAF